MVNLATKILIIQKTTDKYQAVKFIIKKARLKIHIPILTKMLLTIKTTQE